MTIGVSATTTARPWLSFQLTSRIEFKIRAGVSEFSPNRSIKLRDSPLVMPVWQAFTRTGIDSPAQTLTNGAQCYQHTGAQITKKQAVLGKSCQHPVVKLHVAESLHSQLPKVHWNERKVVVAFECSINLGISRSFDSHSRSSIRTCLDHPKQVQIIPQSCPGTEPTLLICIMPLENCMARASESTRRSVPGGSRLIIY